MRASIIKLYQSEQYLSWTGRMSISGLLQNILASYHDDIYIYIKISKNILSIPTRKIKVIEKMDIQLV